MATAALRDLAYFLHEMVLIVRFSADSGVTCGFPRIIAVPLSDRPDNSPVAITLMIVKTTGQSDLIIASSAQFYTVTVVSSHYHI